MKKKTLILSALLTMLAVTVTAQTLPYQDTSLSFHERAVDLVSRLTLAEKTQQMGNMVDQAVDRDDASGTGRVTIPMYQYWNEALHGVARSGAATSFPESKGMSSTWDRQLIFDCATAVMFDHAAKYLWEVLKYMGIPVEELDYNFPKGDYYPTENPFA